MKSSIFATAICLLPLTSCDKQAKVPPPTEADVYADQLKAADIPILAIKAGDFWKYRVIVEVSPGITEADAPAMNVELKKLRTFRGKVQVGEEFPEVDAFDVEVSGQPLERELVEIYEDRIMMRGSIYPNEINAKPLWLDPAVPFVAAGLRPGQQLTKLGVNEGAGSRELKIVAREIVSVPAGDYEAMRLLMTGSDGQLELHKTIWFVPKMGIVKEEKARYASGKLIYRETTELEATNVEFTTK